MKDARGCGIMTKRLQFRPRPVNINKKLLLVRSWHDFDGNDFEQGGSSSRGQDDWSAGIEPGLANGTPRKKAVEGSQIPTPPSVMVETYERNYKCNFLQPKSYIRIQRSRSECGQYCEYDLHDDDENWLFELNATGPILSAEKFESMLYKLEIYDHLRRLQMEKEKPGLFPFKYGKPVPVVLRKEDGVKVLQCILHSPAVLGAVFEYWNGKREILQKPILRRFQPAPALKDPNPFHVFRPRGKVHRRHNWHKKKINREPVHVESDVQIEKVGQYAQHDAMRMDDKDGSPMASRIAGTEDAQRAFFRTDHLNGNGRPLSTADMTPPTYDATARGEGRQACIPRRRRFPLRGSGSKGVPVPVPVPVPEHLEPTFLFTRPLDVGKLVSAGITATNVDLRPLLPSGRVGRGGRIMFDRCNPLTRSTSRSPEPSPYSYGPRY